MNMSEDRMQHAIKNARFMFRSLRLTLLLSIVVPLMLVSGVAIYFGLNAVEDNLNERLREDLELVGRAVSGPLSQAMVDGDEIVLGESLKSIFRIGRVFGASVFDQDGNQVARLGVADNDVTRSVSAERVIASGERGGTFRQVEGVEVFSQFTPLIGADGRIQGLLQVTRKRSDFHELVASSRLWALVLWSLVSVMVILIVVIGHYGSVGRYVNRLLSIMDRMAPGRWRVEDVLEGPREIRQIQQGLQEMGERMMQAETDVRESARREKALSDQLEYQEKVAMIGRVAGGVAHELGAPLSVIQGRANILNRGDLPDTARRHLEDIEHQVNRMTLIIQQLLDCFRHVPDSRRKTDLAKQLRESLVDLKKGAIPKDVDVQVTIPDGKAEILAEPTRLDMACQNVIRNAGQAARSRVVVTLLKHDHHWELRVEDDGPGIDASIRDRIFEPFYTTRAAGEGTGLGLAVVGSVLKEHGGHVDVGDSHQGGCRMSLMWPISEGRQSSGGSRDES
jgi:signal transduction histidine kinase